MGCTSSSVEGGTQAPTFEEAQAHIKKQMRSGIASNFPFSSAEEALANLHFNNGLQSSREVIQRSPEGCYQRTEKLLACVHACTHQNEYVQQDVDALVELVDALLAKGGDVNLIGNKAPWKGLAPLHIIATQSRAHPGICLALAKTLIQQPSLDVNLKTRTAEANTAAHIAALLAQDSLIDLLQPKADFLRITNAAGQTVREAQATGAARMEEEQTASAKKICEAAARGDTTVDLDKALGFLRAHGHNFASDGLQPASGMTLLGLAAAHGNLAKTFAALLRAGCDPAQMDSFGKLPIFYLSDRPHAYRTQIEELLSNHKMSPMPPPSPSSSAASR